MRLLTIGNSLSNDAMFYFPAMAESAGKTIEYFGANIGGLSLEQHAQNLRDSEVGAAAGENHVPGAGGPYLNPFYPARPIGADGTTMLAALTAAPWDYITLQQVTGLSFVAESFEPWCTELITAIRKYVPNAEIAIYQTWAFREDCPDFPALGFDQQSMYHRIKGAYGNVARAHGLGTVPAGWAFQLARSTSPWQFRFPDPAYNYASPRPGDLPVEPGSLNTGWNWGETINALTGGTESTLSLDFKHANPAGKYLAGAVFYETLFGDSAQNIRFEPSELSSAEAASLRDLAHQACATYNPES